MTLKITSDNYENFNPLFSVEYNTHAEIVMCNCV